MRRRLGCGEERTVFLSLSFQKKNVSNVGRVLKAEIFEQKKKVHLEKGWDGHKICSYICS